MVKRFVPSVARNGVFSEIIDRKAKEFNQQRKKVRTALYASDFGNCQRKVFYQFYPELFEGEEIDGKTARIFANGEDVHFRLSAYLADEADLQFERELNVPRDELQVHGRCDGVAMHEGRFFVLEFKSINKQDVEEAKSEHIGQLSWYLGMFEMLRHQLRSEFGVKEGEVVTDPDLLCSDEGRSGTMLSRVEKNLLLSAGPVKGSIIYECKPNQRCPDFYFEHDPERFAMVKAWFSEVRRAVESGVRPQVRYAASRFPCQWSTGRCAYFDLCHGEGAVDDLVVIKSGVRPKKLGLSKVEVMERDKVHDTPLSQEEIEALLIEAEEVAVSDENGSDDDTML